MKTVLLVLLSNLLSLSAALASLPQSYIAVANRGESSISLIDSASSTLIKTITSETLGYEFEPMYVTHLKAAGVFVAGDRKNSELMVFDDNSGELLLREALSQGVFHQWSHPAGDAIAVATDVDSGADVVTFTRDSANGLVVQKQRFDLSGTYKDGKPHDVIVDSKNLYLTIHHQDAAGKKLDRVLKVELETMKVVDVATFSPDVHLGLPNASPYLLVLEQSGTLNFVTRVDLKVVKQVNNLPGAHGVFWNPEGTRIFATNIASSGKDSVYEIENVQKGVAKHIGTADSGFSKPHNISVDFVSERLYLTHSGANDRVSVYDTTNGLKLMGTIQTGKNPFGLGLIQL